MTEKINLTKGNLKKIVQWSSSRYNEYKKAEVINIILNLIKKGEDFKGRFGTGSYAEGGHLRGHGYTLEIKNGRNYLTLDPSGKKYELVSKVKKPKPTFDTRTNVIVLNPVFEYSNICKNCGAENTLEATYYKTRKYYQCSKCNQKTSGGITKTEWKKRKLNYHCTECDKVHRHSTKVWEKHKKFSAKKMTSLERKMKLRKQKSTTHKYKTF
jgi:hypothetical protein